MRESRSERRTKTASLLEKFDKILKNYPQNSSEDNLNALLDFYEELVPNWVEQFNRLNRKISKENPTHNQTFDEFLQVQLPKGYSVEDLKAPKNKDKNSFIDIMNRGRIIHLSNKIAHQFEYMFRQEIIDFLNENNMGSPEEYHEIISLMKKVYSPNAHKRENAKFDLVNKYGFEDSDFEPDSYLNKQNLEGLLKGTTDAMYQKDLEIEKVNELAQKHKRKDVSYGIKKVDDQNTLFVMDIQKFGQFSVHIKDLELISKIRRKYVMPIYQTETQMMVDYKSEKAKEFIKEAQEDSSMDEERGISGRARYSTKQRRRLVAEIDFLDIPEGAKHEIGVKAGLISSDLEKLESKEEGR